MDKSSQELRTVSANLFWKSAPIIDAKYLKTWLQALKNPFSYVENQHCSH